MTETGSENGQDSTEANACHTDDVGHRDGTGSHSRRNKVKHRRVGGAWLEERVTLLRIVFFAAIVVITAGV